ncbi:MAG: hypothetical protein ACYCZF_02525, partial [Anaerolineae bacterium]
MGFPQDGAHHERQKPKEAKWTKATQPADAKILHRVFAAGHKRCQREEPENQPHYEQHCAATYEYSTPYQALVLRGIVAWH